MAVSVQEAASRFQSAGFERADRYQQGTVGKGSAWVGSKARAKANWAPGIQQAIADKAFDRGLDATDANAYEAGVRDKGIANWGTGMQAGSAKYQAKIQKFSGLWGAALPTARGPKRSGANLKRMTENAQRFIDAAK